jgi:DNA replication and repair protein RecF
LVVARFAMAGGERTVEVEVSEGRRVARLDGKPVRDPDELFGGMAVVAFTPDDLSLVRAGPEGRRRLLDRAVQNRHPSHLQDSRDYLRALKSRNELLRQGAPDALREAFDRPLALAGARIRRRREEILGEIEPHALRAFSQVARGEKPLGLRYRVSGSESGREEIPASAERVRTDDQLCDELLLALQSRLPRDRMRGYTSPGPHADDLEIALGDAPARAFASQGQARAIVLAFKIGEIENLRQKQGRAPLLLLDDVSSELDPERNAFLMRYLSALQGQVLLTTTDAAHLVQALSAPLDATNSARESVRLYRVSAGAVELASPPAT